MLDGVQFLAKEGMTMEEAEQRVQQVSKDMQAIIGRSLSHTRIEYGIKLCALAWPRCTICH